MHWDGTIKGLKRKVCQNKGIHVDNVDLVVHGKRLDDDDKWFQTEVPVHVFEQKDTSLLRRFKRWNTGTPDREDVPVLQICNR